MLSLSYLARGTAAAVLPATLLLGACTSSEPVALNGHAALPAQLSTTPEAWFAASTPGLLRPDDRISVTVAREPDLSLADVRIAEDGAFEMPVVGRVMATGRTPNEIGEEIRTRLAGGYLLGPRVAVNVIEAASRTVTIEGAVTHPGVFSYINGTTLMGAIALAQGPTRSAKLNQIAVFRKLGDERAVAVFDLRDVRAGKLVDPVLRPGDLIVVGFSGLAQGWQDFLQAAPVIGIFSRF